MHTMRKSTTLLAGIVVLLFAAAPLLPAQSLLDNDFYKQGKALLAQSQDALDAGDYDTATSLAKQASEALAKSDQWVEDMTKFYRANGWVNQAKDRVAYAKSIQADVNYKDDYDAAVGYLADANTQLDAKSYDEATSSAQSVLAVLADIAPKVAEAPQPEATPTPEQPETPEPVATPVPEQPAPPPLPEYYTVRLVLPLRDCFWRIAAYPWVYNDPWKWKLLYNANKSLLPDPPNPNLVPVGVRIVIPSLAGETRSGDYDPSVQYPAVSSTP
jgi:nucleoid-associated protein YgaU